MQYWVIQLGRACWVRLVNRFCSGSTLVIWFSSGSTLDFSGSTLVLLGSVLVLLWFFPGSVLELLWFCSGSSLVLPWLCFGSLDLCFFLPPAVCFSRFLIFPSSIVLGLFFSSQFLKTRSRSLFVLQPSNRPDQNKHMHTVHSCSPYLQRGRGNERSRQV